jgi:hypothetical protein
LAFERNTVNHVFPRVRIHHLFVLVHAYTYTRSGNQNNQFTFIDEEDRPYIASSGVSPLFIIHRDFLSWSQSSAFAVGDRVYVVNSDGSRDGPFLVASICSSQTCTLSLEDGEAARDGAEVNIAKLEAA